MFNYYMIICNVYQQREFKENPTLPRKSGSAVKPFWGLVSALLSKHSSWTEGRPVVTNRVAVGGVLMRISGESIVPFRRRKGDTLSARNPYR